MYRKKGLHLLACFFLALSLFFLSRTASALTDDEARTFAQQAREQALRAAHKQDMELASMYFVNALSFMPGNIDIIMDYATMILKWAKKAPVFPADSLDALDSFLSAQVMTVKPNDLPQIVNLKEKISLAREESLDGNFPKSDDRPDTKIMEKVARRKEDAKNSQNLKEYLNILQDANSLLEEHGLDDQEIAEGLQAGVMMNSGMEQIEELLSRSSSQSLAPLQMYYLQLAETSLQQLVALSLNLPQGVTQEVLQIKEKLDKRIQDVAEGRSGAAMEVIKNSYAKLKESNNGHTFQEKINGINIFMRDVTLQSQNISSPQVSDELSKLLETVQQQLSDYRAKQMRRYNEWAMEQMKKALKNSWIEELSYIDTRLLDFGAQQCLNRVWGELYFKLDNTEKSDIEKAMVFKEKRKLEDF